VDDAVKSTGFQKKSGAFCMLHGKWVKLHVFCTVPIFHWGEGLGSAEDLGEIAQRGEAQQLGDLRHGQVRLGQ